MAFPENDIKRLGRALAESVSVDSGHTTIMSLDAIRHWPLPLEALRDRVGGKRIVSVDQVAIYFLIVRSSVGIATNELSKSNYYSD